MIRLVFPTPIEQMPSVIVSIKARMEVMVEYKYLSKVPTITTELPKLKMDGFSVLVFSDYPPEDQMVLFGFYMGFDFTRNNLQLFSE
jgi:hypothetical protein